MDTTHHLSFLLAPLGSRGKAIQTASSAAAKPSTQPLAVIPVIDGVPLTDLIRAFDVQQNHDAPGGYDGLVPQVHLFPPNDIYFMDQSDWEDPQARCYLLGCGCGVISCWPLLARVSRARNHVTWSHFLQPHRPGRDYSAFGPFTFGKKRYLHAIRELRQRL